MDKSKELEIIAKYNLDNKTNFYKMDQVLDHIYKNAKAKDDALSRIAAGQIAQTEGPGAVLRDEHSGYTYYTLPNFNIRNAKHLLGDDLTQPVEKSWAIYRKQGGKL